MCNMRNEFSSVFFLAQSGIWQVLCLRPSAVIEHTAATSVYAVFVRFRLIWLLCWNWRVSVMEGDFVDFLVEDELSSVTLLVEDQRLYVHKEVLAQWSPVFRAMFVGMFKERNMKEVELPEKKVEDFVELLHCMYPPIHPITGWWLMLICVE